MNKLKLRKVERNHFVKILIKYENNISKLVNNLLQGTNKKLLKNKILFTLKNLIIEKRS